MRYFDPIYGAIFFILLVSCRGDIPPESPVVAPVARFDTFFREQLEHLMSEKYGLHKTVNQQNRISQATIPNPDWAGEFSLFMSLGLSKPVMSGKFSTDTLVREDGMVLYIFSAMDDEEKVRRIEWLAGPDGNTELIVIETFEKNPLYRSGYALSYQPLKGYRIQGVRKDLLREETEFEIFAEFFKPGSPE
jgi:hypothetical protein